MAGLVAMDATMTVGGQFLSAAQLEALEHGLNVYLSHYYRLASDAQRQGQALWKVVPKHHLLEHMVLDQAVFQNPRHYHGYSDEAGCAQPGIGRVHQMFFLRVQTCNALCAGLRREDEGDLHEVPSPHTGAAGQAPSPNMLLRGCLFLARALCAPLCMQSIARSTEAGQRWAMQVALRWQVGGRRRPSDCAD